MQHKLTAKWCFVEMFIEAFAQHQLGDAITVSKIDKGNGGAKLAHGLHPASQGYGLTDVVCAELAAGMGTVHGGGFFMGCQQQRKSS